MLLHLGRFAIDQPDFHGGFNAFGDTSMPTRKLCFARLEDRRLLTGDLPTLTLDDTTGFVVGVLGSEGGTDIYEVGDLNGDGLEDLGVGGLHYSLEEDTYIGSLHILFGNEEVPTSGSRSTRFSDDYFDIYSLDGTNGFEMVGYYYAPSNDPVAALGDVNGDGIDDLGIVRDTEGLTGYVDVLFGSREPFEATLSQDDVRASGFTIVQSGAFAGGTSSVGAGDINGDGLGDVIVGGKFNMGVSVIYGSETPANELNVANLGPEEGFSLVVEDRKDYGYLDAADVNGDGIEDLLVASEIGDSAYVVFGSRDSLPTRIKPQDLNGSNGFSIRSMPSSQLIAVGDVNADGFEDIAIATVGPPVGKIQIVFGSAQFDAIVDATDFSPSQGFVVEGSVAGPGDVNGDGFDDLLLGNPSIPGGSIYVLYGGPSIDGDVFTLTPSTGFGFAGRFGDMWNDQLGYAVSRLGDFNGDAFNDLFFRPQGINGDYRAIVLLGRPSPVPGDANGDGTTDFKDFLIFANNFGKEDAVFADGDFDGDGRVSFLDFLVLAGNFVAG